MAVVWGTNSCLEVSSPTLCRPSLDTRQSVLFLLAINGLEIEQDINGTPGVLGHTCTLTLLAVHRETLPPMTIMFHGSGVVPGATSCTLTMRLFLEVVFLTDFSSISVKRGLPTGRRNVLIENVDPISHRSIKYVCCSPYLIEASRAII